MADNVKRVKQLLQLPGNQACADCGDNGKGKVRFCSVKLGVFLCNQCYAAHRALGAHITRGKCIGLDGFTTQEVDLLSRVGNVNANSQYEASMPPNSKPPPTPCNGCSSSSCKDCKQRLKFISDKYEKRLWFSTTPVIPTPVVEGGMSSITPGTAPGTTKSTPTTNDDPFGLFSTTSTPAPSNQQPKQSTDFDFFASFGV